MKLHASSMLELPKNGILPRRIETEAFQYPVQVKGGTTGTHLLPQSKQPIFL